MELNQLIGEVLNQLELSKQNEHKMKYLVDEVILELNVSTDKEGQVNVIGIGGRISKNSSHKMTVKLVPNTNKSKK